jgi:flagellar motor component MotA
MNNLTKKPKLSDYIGAAILGAILGAFLAWGLLNGGF